MDKRNDWVYNSFKRKCFTKINENVQSKYSAMQQRLEKSRSVDSLSTLKENYVLSEQRYASNYDIRESYEFVHIEESKPAEQYDKQTVFVENINKKDANIEYFEYGEANISDSEAELTPNEKYETNVSVSNRFFGNQFSKNSLESLIEVTGESDEYLTAPTPSSSPKISIRNKIGSRITAAREKRRVEKERNEAKYKKKEYSDKVEKLLLSNSTKQDVKLFKKSRVGTLTIALIEALGFENENPEEKSRILFCRFRLGNEKYKSKLLKSSTSQFKWQELFHFSIYEDNNILEIYLWDKDTLVGRGFIDLNEVEKEKTHRMRITLEGELKNVQIFVLLTISGLSLANTLLDLDDYQETQRQLSTTRKKFAWYRFNNDLGAVGWLSVIVYGAKGLSSNDCYCVLELDNERRQTYTESKTNEPNWMKIFNFAITDITSILDVTVHDEKKTEDVGKLSIPLLSVSGSQKKWYALKDMSQRERARGNNPRILLELIIMWNLARASIKVINTKEAKMITPSEKLDRHTFARNLSRAKSVLMWTFNMFQVIKSCFEWESRKLNIIALICWLLFCWFFKIWMLPLLLLVPFIIYRPRKYYLISWKDYLLNEYENNEIEDNTNKREEKNTTLRQKFQSLQEMMQSVQNFIGKFASLGESIKNLFNFTVPFVSFLAIFLIVLISFVMYVIPTKYIFMIWGIHKLTRKILRPNRIPNNEILDLLSRVPDDEKLLDFEEISLENLPEEDVIK